MQVGDLSSEASRLTTEIVEMIVRHVMGPPPGAIRVTAALVPDV